MEGRYANIIVDISHEKVDRPFQYIIPDSLRDQIEVGVRVRVPFGMGNKIQEGYVMEVTDRSDYPEDRLKTILEVVEHSIALEGRSLKLSWWIKQNYGSTMIAAVKTVLPVKQTVKAAEKKSVELLITPEEARRLAEQAEKKKQPAKARLLLELADEKKVPYGLLTGKLQVSAQTIQSLAKQEVLQVASESSYRNPYHFSGERTEPCILTDVQQNIADDFVREYGEGIRRTYLLYGITGSGKTEIYLEMIAKVLAEGKSAIFLIPEISLTYQTVLRFYKRFGDKVSVVNSRLSAGEKYDQFQRAKRGEVQVMIGPRSALFTPFSNLGIIILDEEHEASYKSEGIPRYHARETAIELARMTGSSVVLGSATPSLESFYQAQQGNYKLYQIRERLAGVSLATVHTVDLREELQQGNRSMFSEKLKEGIRERLQKGQQTMLFLNRRGYAGFVSCRSCGYVVKCPHCDVSLTDHRNGKLVCHYCGYERERYQKCPSCGSKYIMGFRAGTEQVEELLHKDFPGARILRMDGDTTRKKEDYDKILAAFANEKADILVGTQMIVKGHDFPKVTLVGVLAADLSLAAGDYRACERTFQLLTQAAGRAGRGSLPGEVVIQTYQPDNYSVVHAANQDYESFYQEEIQYRELMGYPPAAHMLAIMVQGKEEIRTRQQAEEIAELLRNRKTAVVIGPAAASIGKINDMYRQVVYVKHKEYQVLVGMKDVTEEYLDGKEQNQGKIAVYFDFDPMNA